MKTAIIGGSFNPPHIGHIHLINQVLRSTDFTRIILVPLHTPNHKSVENEIDPQHRVNMVRLLAENIPVGCIVDSCEIERGGISYTYDTVKEILGRYEDTNEIGIIIGDDLLSGLVEWNRFDLLKEIASFLVVRRESDSLDVLEMIDKIRKNRVSIELLTNRIVEVSSSEIRRRIEAGEDASRLLPLNVLSYIQEHGLYR